MRHGTLIVAIAWALASCGGRDERVGTGTLTGPPDAEADAFDATATDAGEPDADLDAGSDCAFRGAPVVPAGAAVTVLASNQADPVAIAVDSTSVYWTNGGPLGGGKAAYRLPGSIMKLPLDGGTPITLAAQQIDPSGVVLDSTSMYWSTGSSTLLSTDGGRVSGTVKRLPLDGGAAVTLVSTPMPGGIAVDARNLYWINRGLLTDNEYDDNADGTVTQTPLDGGAPIVLATGQNWPSGVAVDGTDVYWTNAGGFRSTNGAVLSVPIGGGQITTLASEQDGPRGLFLRGDRVYWLNAGQDQTSLMGQICFVPKAGGTPVVLASGYAPLGLALGARDAFWADDSIANDDIFAVPLDGGCPVSVPWGSGLALDLAVTSNRLYWVTYEGDVMTMPIE